MISFIEYDSGLELKVRLRDVNGQFWDFTAGEWVETENPYTFMLYTETPHGDDTSLYTADVTIPTGGPFIQEVFENVEEEPIASDIAYDPFLPTDERLDHLDADISAIPTTPLLVEDYTTPPTVTAIRQEMDANSTRLAKLDANVSTRSTYAGGAVASVTGSVGSVTNPVTVGTNQDKTGYGLSTAAVLAVWNQATEAGGILVNTFGAKLRDWVLGTDSKAVISTDTQDLSATLKVDAKVVEDKTGYALTGAYDAAKTAATQTSVNAIPTAPLLAADSRLDNLDAPVSGIPTTPLLASNYVAPDNDGITTISSILQNATYGLEVIHNQIDAIISDMSVDTDVQTLLTRLSDVRADLIDNLQYLTEAPVSMTTEQVELLTEARDEAKLSRQLKSNKAVVAPDGESVTIYADDGTTPLWIFSIPDNKTRIPV